jgi:hypothetical protein
MFCPNRASFENGVRKLRGAAVEISRRRAGIPRRSAQEGVEFTHRLTARSALQSSCRIDIPGVARNVTVTNWDLRQILATIGTRNALNCERCLSEVL